MSATESQTRELSSLDVGAIIELDDEDGLVKLVDVKLSEYLCGVWAYVDAETGEYGGLLEDGGGLAHKSVEVKFHRWADE